MIDYLTDPKLWLLIIILGIWGAVARLPNYYGGQLGRKKIEEAYPRIKPESWDRAQDFFDRLGPIPLLFASIPLLGSILTIAAGMAGIERLIFLITVTISKIIRNWLLVFLIAYFL